jgi:lipoprotein-releasing system permease protein
MLSLKIAIRFLKSGRGQTVLITVGIGIAIAAQIFIGLLITSLQKTLVNRTVGHQPQITILSAGDSLVIQDWQALVNKIDQSGLVKNISVSASGNAFIQRGSRSGPVLFRGLDSQAVDNIYRIQKDIYEGAWQPSQPGVLVGKDLVEEFNFNLGDSLQVKTPGGSSATYVIAGFYDLGVAQINKTWIIASLDSARALFGYGGNVTSIEMTVNDLFKADFIAGQLQSLINDNNLSITNWKAQNSELLSGLQGQSLSSLMIQIFIVVSVVIAIASILAITVFQKSRQIGILKAMGIKNRSASLIFVFEGLIIGLIASVIGVLLGLGLLYGFAVGTSKPGSPALIDLYIDYKFIILSWGIAILASVLAAMIPARRSLRLNPIDVIREG